MEVFPCPKLKNQRTGTEIEINANPFSIGRGLSCNYILPNKTVSRVHCVLEKNDDNRWVLRDSSTNGTFVNNRLVKHVKSSPLQNNDVIYLDLERADSYRFITNEAVDDISDEQLCAIADSVLQEMGLNSNVANTANDEQSGAVGLRRSAPVSPVIDPLLDHIYSTKSSNEVTKKPRTCHSPRPALGNRKDAETASRSAGEPTPTASNGAGTAAPERMVESPPPGRGRNPEMSAGTLQNANSAVSTARKDEESPGLTQPNTDGDSTGSDVEIVGGTSGTGEAAARLNEVVPSPARPGPSKVKSVKPEQPDHYEVMENELQCVICSELFIKALTLNCSHTFCKYCIGMWNKNKSDCPICRTKITSTTATIVLDNVVEKVIENSNEDIKQHRRTVLEERSKMEEAEGKAAAEQHAEQQGRGRGRLRARAGRRGRGGRNNRTQDPPPRINVLDPVAINIGALVNNVIEVSSDSDWTSDTESMSPDDMADEYYQEDWYESRSNYWGGYGYCYRCGSPTHWANSCPNR